jgi:uncharacterized NAD(P)/FAD-binding protein YdhS
MSRYDIAIIGGGFSGLAVLANLVKTLPRPLSIAVISREPAGVFGPAYSTPRQEHLLNVRASAMGLFADDHAHFLKWAQGAGHDVKPGDYLPRPLYGQYLAAVLAETKALAAERNIPLDFFQGEVEDVADEDEYLEIRSGGDIIPARYVVLAVGNSLKAKEDSVPGLVANTWHYDFAELKGKSKVAIIGSGLTAADAIISILRSGWTGNMTCFSGTGLLPRAHLPEYDATRVPKADGGRFLNQRLSTIMRELRKDIKAGGVEWQYIIDSLRPLTQDIWRSLGATDKKRLAEKYFTLWNVHRHRYASHIGKEIDAAIASGQLTLEKAKCRDVSPVEGGVSIELISRTAPPRRETFDIAFNCVGVNYKIDNNPLLKKMTESGLLKRATNPYGVTASDNFVAARKLGGMVLVFGTPLFGQLFETTAVPELRMQAAAVAKSITSTLQ